MRNRRNEALRRIGIEDLALVEGVPVISHDLENAEGGIPQVILALRSCDDPDAQRFIKKYDSISSSDLARVSLEEIIVASGVTTKRMFELAMTALREQCQNVATIIAATSHRPVLEKTIQMALRDGGVKDREMLHSAVGFLPAPKGSTTIIDRRIQIANLSRPDEPAQAMEVPEDLPMMENDIQSLHAMATGKMLEAPTDSDVRTIENS